MRITKGVLADIDLVALGARTELIWRSSEVTLIGLGAARRVDVALGASEDGIDPASRYLRKLRVTDDADLAGSGAVGFMTLPFDRDAPGLMIVPAVVIGERDGVRFVTLTDDYSLDDVTAQVESLLAEPLAAKPDSVELHLDRSAESWRDDVVTVARDRIAGSDLQKAVFARELMLEASSPFAIGRTIEYLAQRFTHAQVFAVDGFIGASPEQLVSRNQRVVRAHPLAGTAPRSTNETVDAEHIGALLASTKDRVEHQITIDWFLTELLPFCSYVDAEPEPSVLTLPNVHHLGTLVEGMLSEPASSVLELVRAVHPLSLIHI